MRFTPEQAVAMGIITKGDAQAMKEAGAKKQANFLKKTAPTATAKTKALTAAAKVLQAANDPQTMLYEALVKRLGADAVEWEVPNLIEGRQFRVDILISRSVVVEMDGFQFHRSKTAFQKDRERQNLFAANGYVVFRTFAKEIFDLERRTELVELIAGAHDRLMKSNLMGDSRLPIGLP